MAIYDKEQGFQSVLNAALGEYQPRGFRLAELDNHALMLCYQEEPIGTFTRGGSTIPTIRGACREYLESLSAS